MQDNIISNLFSDHFYHQQGNYEIDPVYQVCANRESIEQCSKVFAYGIEIRQPMQVPFCYLSLYIGIRSAKQAYDSKLPSHRIYALLFGLTGVMMTCASITDCFLQGSSFVNNFFFITDVSLTSGIGIGFLFAGLVDAKIIKESKETFLMFLAVLAVIFFLWYEVVLYNAYHIGFTYIYLGCVSIGCGLYLFLQLRLFQKGYFKQGFDTFVLIGILGFLGLYSTFSDEARIWICEHYNCYLSGDYLWFFVTPLCIYLLKLYFLKSHKNLESDDNMQINLQQTLNSQQNQYQNIQNQQYVMEMQDQSQINNAQSYNYNYPVAQHNMYQRHIEQNQQGNSNIQQQNVQFPQQQQQQMPQFIYVPVQVQQRDSQK